MMIIGRNQYEYRYTPLNLAEFGLIFVSEAENKYCTNMEGLHPPCLYICLDKSDQTLHKITWPCTLVGYFFANIFFPNLLFTVGWGREFESVDFLQ